MYKKQGDDMSNVYIALDLETTGVDPTTCKIIEIGAVKFDEKGNMLENFSEFANPGARISSYIQKLTGIDDQMVNDADTPIEVWNRFLLWCGDQKILFAHNAIFEARFIEALYNDKDEKPDISLICTLLLARKQLKKVRNHSLSHLVPGTSGCRALPGAQACAQLCQRLILTYDSGKIPIGNYLMHIF